MKFNCKTPSELLKNIKNLDVKMVDVRFTDIPGTTQHFTLPIKFLDESIFSEGISLDILSCLILGTPVNNEPLLTQLIGRIIRQYEGKKQPTVVDVHLIGKTAKRQASARLGYYIKQGYEVSTL